MNRSLQINSIALHRWIPLFLISAFVIVLSVMLLRDMSLARHHLQEDEQRILHLINTQSLLPLRRALEQERSQDQLGLLSAIATDQEVAWALISDESRQIVQASRYAWRGRALDEVLPATRSLISSSLENSLQVLELERLLLSIKPIVFSDPESDSDLRTYYLWVALDTSFRDKRLLSAGFTNLLVVLLGALLVLMVLIWILKRFVEHPLATLATATHAIAQGNLQTRLEVRGEGEIAELAQTLQVMEEQIRSNLEAANASEKRLAITLDSIGDAVLVTDSLGLVTRMNPTAERLTGWAADDAIGHPVIEVFQIVNAETREPAEHPVGRVLREGIVVGLANHTTLIARDGTEYQIADSAAPINDEEGQALGVIMVFQDVTDRYAIESEMKEVRERMQAILTSLPDPCFLLDAEGRYVEILGGPEELLAEERAFLLGKCVNDVLPPEQAMPIMQTLQKTVHSGKPQRIEYALDTLSGERLFEGSTALIHSSEKREVIWLARDFTERKQAEERLHHLARYDQLTGLANRDLTSQRLEQILHSNRRSGHFGAVMFIDVDRFKTINDSLGHQLGDHLLRQIGEILENGIRKEDMAARFGGDEFVILLGDLGPDRMSASTHAELIGEKLRHACTRPFQLDGQQLQVTISIGVVLFPEDGSDVADLLKRADIAMYKAKEAGRNRICFFSPELQEIAESRLTIQRELRAALEQDQFRLYVHPRVDASGHWIGGEVLVRWQHPERGLLLPGNFIPVAENSGVIDDIDQWVISRTIAGLGAIRDELPPGFAGLSMNITTDLLLNPRFPAEIQHWCMEHAVPPERLEMEITERVLLEDHAQAAEIIETLRHFGVLFSIDDFGTGYSSLRYLQRLPLNTLKIDKSFVDRVPAHPGDARIVTTIIDMAGHLALEVVAEGVETEEQREFLKELGCHQFQGFLFARPLPWDDFFAALPEHQPVS